MRLTRLEKLILLANAIFRLVFGVWFIQTIEPLPTNALELQDSVNYPVTRTSHLPYEATRSSAVWQLTSAIQFPSAAVSKLIVPTYRYDSTFLGGTLLVWRLVLTVLLSFIQWFALARMLRWLMRFVEHSKRQPRSA